MNYINRIKSKAMKKTKVLFLNHKAERCGVYQYGKRLCNIIKQSKRLDIIYHEIDSYAEYNQVMNSFFDVSIVVYNFHTSTMPFLHQSTIYKGKFKNFGIPHESPGAMFDAIIDIDPLSVNDPIKKSYSIPRPLFKLPEPEDLLQEPVKHVSEFINYVEGTIPIFGSFGFGVDNKGFERIVQIVNDQINAAIIKILMPNAFFDPVKNHAESLAAELYKIPRKPGIKLMIIHDFLTDDEILLFLSKNTMNLFLYDKMPGRGISSVIDYALSVTTPFAISDSEMFRHIYHDSICAYKHTLAECMTSMHLKELQKSSQENNMLLLSRIESILRPIL